MTICAKCGFENENNTKNCVNCLTDLHWAKVNLGKYHGTADDTRKIGIASRKERGYPVPEDEVTPLEPIYETITNNNEKNSHTVKYWPLIGILVGLVPGLIWFFLTRNSLGTGILYLICIGPGGIVSGIVGASIGKRDNIAVWIVAFIISILGAGLLFMLAMFSCVFCM